MELRVVPPERAREPDPRLRAAVPAVLAGDRRLAVPGTLGELLPGGGPARGTVVAVTGVPGAGATTLVLALAAAATGAGEWVAVVDPDGRLGGWAAAEAGIDLERFAVVRTVPRDRWPVVVAALLDGCALVAADVPPGLRAGDARRLAARARERDAVLVVREVPGPGRAGATWPADGVALRCAAHGGPWTGLEAGEGLLAGREVAVEVTGRAGASRPRRGVVARTA